MKLSINFDVNHQISGLLYKKSLGDHLNDRELMALIRHLGTVSALLVVMGETFRLPFKETHSLFLELYDCAVNRKLVENNGYSIEIIDRWIKGNA
jgi:hypothetical protein